MLARSHNRRLPQRRPLRERLPSVRQVGGWLWGVLRRAAPTLARATALAALILAVLALRGWLLSSPRFAVAHVVVDGNRQVGRDQILRVAGVDAGQNIFELSPRQIEEAVAEDPWIERVEVRRRLPDRVDIHVVERRAAALISVEGAGLYLADAAGRPFKRAAVHDGEGAGLVIVSGLSRALFASGPAGGSERSAALVQHALRVAELWGSGGRPPAGEVHLGREGVTLRTLEGGVAIVLGRGGDATLLAAMRRFDAIWAALPPSERVAARRIHLDSLTRPDRVTVSLAEPTR
jgi:cell division protein FtsQ